MRYSDNAKTQAASTITNADVVGSPIQIQQDYMYAVHAIWTDSGSLAGTVKLQASIDGTNWSDVPGSSEPVSGNSSFLWNVTAAAYKFVRSYFTYSAGSGTIKTIFATKGP